MHIHFWWGCIDNSVPSLLGMDCSWWSQQPEKVGQHWKITPGLYAHSGSHRRVRMDTFGERNQGCWRHGGTAWEAGAWAAAAAGPGCDLQHGRFTLPLVCVGWPMQAACSFCSVKSPHFTCAFLLSTSLRCSAVPAWALCCSGSPRAGCSLIFLTCCSAIFALPYYKKGSLFIIFLYKIWSCLVVKTEWLGSAGSPKFSCSFGYRLQLCVYML